MEGKIIGSPLAMIELGDFKKPAGFLELACSSRACDLYMPSRMRAKRADAKLGYIELYLHREMRC